MVPDPATLNQKFVVGPTEMSIDEKQCSIDQKTLSCAGPNLDPSVLTFKWSDEGIMQQLYCCPEAFTRPDGKQTNYTLYRV